MKIGIGLAVAAVVVAAAGCSSDPVLTVGSAHLAVKDQIYQSTSTYFCDGLAPDQVKFRFVDYGPACAIDRPAGSADPRDPAKEHTELTLIVSFGGNPRWPTTAFDATGDCVTGGANALATFSHFAANSTTADTVMKATAGKINIGTYDATGKNPTTGNFDVTIGGSQVKGSINSYSCN